MYVYGGTLIPDGIEPDAIVAADPRFSRPDFLEFAGSVFRNVHAAAASGDAKRVRGVTGEALQATLSRRRAGPLERLDHVSILEATHAAVDTIVVRFGAVIGGRQVVEDWVFQRDAHAYPHLRGVIPSGCSSCGAPLATDEKGNCRYCGTHVLGVAGAWIVQNVLPPRIVEGPRGPSASDVLGPEHGQADLLAFVRSIYTNVHAAIGGGRIGSIHGVLTDALRRRIADDPEHHCWGVPIFSIEDVAIVNVQRGALEVITVRIQATSEGGSIVEDWTFERPASIPGTATSACTFCGAPARLDERGNCTHCKTHLLGVAGDWRLARAIQPSAMATHPAVVRAMQSKGGRLLILLFLTFGLAVTIAMIVAIIKFM